MPPTFSIVVATFERPAELARCLAAISRLDYPRDEFEVIVVDDGGSRGLDPALAAAGDVPLMFDRQANAGPATARNRGVALARGRYVAFTDDDCEPAPDWLAKLEEPLAAGAVAVAGRTTNAAPDNACATAGQLLVDFLLGYYNRHRGDARFGTTNDFAIDRETLLAIGAFDESFGLTPSEDRELVHRLRARGHKLAYAPDAAVHHQHRQDLSAFWRQHYGYGRGAVLFRRRAGHGGLEPLSFYAGIVRAPSGRPALRAKLVALLALSQVALTAGFVRERLRAEPHRVT